MLPYELEETKKANNNYDCAFNSKSEIRFDFHNVGQGLFYSGKIGNYNFVYDCGSTSSGKYIDIEKVIDNYIKNILENPYIDLLVISHFHLDHISGIDHLLENTKVKKVVFPFLTKEEKFLLKVEFFSIDANVKKVYLEILETPLKYFFEKGVEKVYVMFGNESKDNKNENDLNDINDIDFSKEDIRLDFNEVINNENDLKKKEILEQENIFLNDYKDKLKVINTNFCLKSKYWVFDFFVNESLFDSTKIKEFKKYLSDNNIDSKFFDNLESNYKEILKNIKNNAKKIFGDNYLNNSSVLLAHYGALSKYNLKIINNPFWQNNHSCNYCGICSWDYRYNWYDLYHCYCQFIKCVTKKYGVNNRRYFKQLLTGDIDLKRSYTNIENHYSDLKEFSVIQIPHHGSENNWDKKIAKEKVFFPVSYGIKNRYKHPHNRVIEDIKKNNGFYLRNNEERIISLLFTKKYNYQDKTC